MLIPMILVEVCLNIFGFVAMYLAGLTCFGMFICLWVLQCRPVLRFSTFHIELKSHQSQEHVFDTMVSIQTPLSSGVTHSICQRTPSHCRICFFVAIYLEMQCLQSITCSKAKNCNDIDEFQVQNMKWFHSHLQQFQYVSVYFTSTAVGCSVY